MEITELRAAVQDLVNDQDYSTLELLYAMLIDRQDSYLEAETLEKSYQAMAQDTQREYEANEWMENTFTEFES